MVTRRSALLRGVGAVAGGCLLCGSIALNRLRSPFSGGTAEPTHRPGRPLQPLRLAEIFTPGTRFRFPDPKEIFTTSVHDGGELVMPTGHLVAADPGLLSDPPAPFLATVRPGRYRVRLAVVTSASDERVAAAKLLITDNEPVRWELALSKGQDPHELGLDEFFGYGVDSGTGCLVDASVATAMDPIVRDYFNNNHDIDNEAKSLTEPTSGATLVLFNSGWGDGSYPTWVGRDRNGGIACFVSDMLVVRNAPIVA